MAESRQSQITGIPGRRIQQIVAVLIVVVALAAGYLASRDGTEQANQAMSRFDLDGARDESDDPMRAAWSELERGTEERKHLSERIAELQAELSTLRQIMADAATGPSDSTDEDPQRTDPSASNTIAPSAGDGETNLVHFDDDALRSQGVSPDEINRLHERWTEHELEIFAIADQAIREGWFLQPLHGAELRRLDQALRSDLDDDEYDQYLYALSQPNRLTTGEVFAGSAASEAGLRRGDIILSYGGKRVFKPGELLIASSEGRLGESVPIKILRDGLEQTLYVDRGPLGAQLKHSRGAPVGR
jgi:hypothetical protein